MRNMSRFEAARTPTLQHYHYMWKIDNGEEAISALEITSVALSRWLHKLESWKANDNKKFNKTNERCQWLEEKQTYGHFKWQAERIANEPI